MRIVGLSFAILAVAALSARANVGDQWILGIDHLDNPGAFTDEGAGTGFVGAQSSGSPALAGHAVFHASAGAEGVTRVYWDLDGVSVNNGNPVPPEAELYTIEFWGIPDGGHNSWQPVESQFNGAAGETFPIEPGIPWAGQFGTNHQYISADGQDNNVFNPEGPGPRAPESAAFGAGGNGIYMWLKAGSWLYSKWDFPFPIDRSWSAFP